jgi:hypothetical protein
MVYAMNRFVLKQALAKLTAAVQGRLNGSGIESFVELYGYDTMEGIIKIKIMLYTEKYTGVPFENL